MADQCSLDILRQRHGKKKTLAEQICTELTVHTKIEEDIFYPACEGKVEEDLLKEAYVEHDSANVLIAEIEAGGPGRRILRRQGQGAVGDNRAPRQGRGTARRGYVSQTRKAGLDMDALASRWRRTRRSGSPTTRSAACRSPKRRAWTAPRSRLTDRQAAREVRERRRPGDGDARRLSAARRIRAKRGGARSGLQGLRDVAAVIHTGVKIAPHDGALDSQEPLPRRDRPAGQARRRRSGHRAQPFRPYGVLRAGQARGRHGG